MGNPTVEKVVANKQSVVEPDHVVARHEYVDSSARQYGAALKYATALDARWPDGSGEKAWYEVGGKEVNEFAKVVNGERDALYAELEAVGIKGGTARKRWFDIREKGRILREGEPEQGEGGGSERPLDTYIPEESLKMYKRIARAEKRSENAAKALKLAQQLCELYKINLNNI